MNKQQVNKNKLGYSFYGSIILTLILHYFWISNINISSTGQVAISFLVFNIIFGVANILLKIDFGGSN